MANTSLINDYSQQYSNLTSDIIARTAQIPNLSGNDKTKQVRHVEGLFGETKELLEQMQLEVYSTPAEHRNKHHMLVDGFKKQLTSLEGELRKSRISLGREAANRHDLFSYEMSDNQRGRLLDNGEQLSRLGRNMDDSYRTCIDTEEIGNSVLMDLGEQRESIQRSRNRLRETNEELGQSSRILSAMMKRVIQNKILLTVIVVIIFIVICFSIYLSMK